MKITPLVIEGSWVADLEVHSDIRGSFQEWFKFDEILTMTGYQFETNQANFSKSSKNVIRGIHYSLAKGGQAKWITCFSGAIRDFIVDIRLGSPTYGQWTSIELSENNPKAVLIGEGLGHAFMALEDKTCISYLLNSKYSIHEEFQINPFDISLGIEWGANKDSVILSDNDLLAPTLSTQENLEQLPIYKS
jgi:dTDP-4-dehydrorhamnose 3,5-epimerase